MEESIKKAKNLMLHQNWTMEAAFRAAFGVPNEEEEITSLSTDKEDYPAFSGALPFAVHVQKAAVKPPFDFYVVHRSVLDMLAPFEELGMYGKLVVCSKKVIRADDLFTAARFLLEYRGWGFPLTAEQRAVDAFLRRLPVDVFAAVVGEKLPRVVQSPWTFDEFLS